MEISTNLYRPTSHTRIQAPQTYLSSVLKPHERQLATSNHNKPGKPSIASSHTRKYDKENQVHAKQIPKKDDKIDRLMRIDKIKASNIDELNLKIKNMVNKLTIQQSPVYSFVKENPQKERFKMEYSNSEYELNQPVNFSKEQQERNSKIQPCSRLQGCNNLAVSKIIDPVFSSLDREKFKERSAKKYQLQRIRSKYKNSQKQLTSSSTFNSKVQTFNSKLKSSTKTEFHNMSIESNLTASFASDKENSTIQSVCLGKKRDICKDIAVYQRKVQDYNDRKQALLSQCRKKPLQDTTKTYCNLLNMDSKMQQGTVQKAIDLFQVANKSDEESDPPTADFRMNQQENQLKMLLSNLIDQIKLDQKFRNAKKWFSRLASSNKWRQLDRILSKNGVTLDEESITEIFSLQDQEENPFYCYKERDFDIRTVAEQFIKCEQNWFVNLVKKFDRSNLETAGFRSRNIDTTQKGYLNIEDLVRFLNVEMDVHYRTRDLYLIYLRLKNEHRLTYEDVIEVICY